MSKSLPTIDKFFFEHDLEESAKNCVGLEEDFLFLKCEEKTGECIAVVRYSNEIEDAIKRIKACEDIPIEYRDKIKVIDNDTYSKMHQGKEEKVVCETEEGEEDICYYKYSRQEVEKMQMKIPFKEFKALISKDLLSRIEIHKDRLIGIYIAPKVALHNFADIFSGEGFGYLIAIPKKYANKRVAFCYATLTRKKKQTIVLSEGIGDSIVEKDGIVEIEANFVEDNEDFEPSKVPIAIAVAFLDIDPMLLWLPYFISMEMHHRVRKNKKN